MVVKKTVLITGVTGYLGSHIAETLIENGYNVVGLKRRISSLHRVETFLSDISMYDVEGLSFAVPFQMHKNIDTIIHTATCYGRNNESSGQIFEANTVFPLKLMEAAITAGVSTFLNTDTSLDKYLNAYSLSKKQFMEWGKYFATREKIHFLNARLEHFYGAGDDGSKFATHIIKSCLRDVPELELTLGEQRRDFIYIEDVVGAFLTVLKKKSMFEDWFESFDVGSGKAVSIKQFVETVHRLTASETSLKFGAYPYREGEVMFSQADTSALKKLGWERKTSLDKGLEKIIKMEKVNMCVCKASSNG